MNETEKVPEGVVRDLLATSGFVFTGQIDEAGELWIHGDRNIPLNVPQPEDGYFARSVFSDLQRIVDELGL